MESETLKILFIGGDEQFARAVGGMLDAASEMVAVPTMDAAMPSLSGAHPFQAVLVDLPAADKDGLLQVGLLSVKKPRLPFLFLARQTIRRSRRKLSGRVRRIIWPRRDLTGPSCNAPFAARWNASMSAPP